MSEPLVEAVLEAIRAVELDVAQRIDDTKASAAKALSDARGKATLVVPEARERGLRRAERQYQDRVDAARAEAMKIEADAAVAIDASLLRLRPRLAELVDRMLLEVVTTDTEEGP